MHQEFKERTIGYWFHRLVDGDDYEASNEREVVQFLKDLSKKPRTALKRRLTPLEKELGFISKYWVTDTVDPWPLR
jgi:hypothetical protein